MYYFFNQASKRSIAAKAQIYCAVTLCIYWNIFPEIVLTLLILRLLSCFELCCQTYI